MPSVHNSGRMKSLDTLRLKAVWTSGKQSALKI
jgi:hypothetical protein